ncbi:rhomboid-domain-containing protein [Polyporus arcularius HHB13444]|uniref:Rhomboid-domain-containing protein n=1 Tax=Polyporus arcularius HHB13444 TaxID=1314778 RepID=A0A5C3PNS3_9APHY|nr:rhomboid-domain-containing protein [Polyporus arcularius HHB13444]
MLWTLRSPRAWSLPCRPPRSFPSHHSTRLARFVSESAPKHPSFVEEVAKTRPVPSFAETVRKVPIRNQILFTIAGTVGALTIGAHLTNYDLFKWWAYLRASPQGGYDKSRPPTSEELARVKYFAYGRDLQTALASLKSAIDPLPETMKAMLTYSYVQVFQPILNATEGKRMCWAIGAVNCVVWLAWRVPRWGPVMMRSFAHNPLSGRSYTLFTSMFSHESFFHLLFNCMALASFGAAAGQQLMLQFKKVEQERGAVSEASPKWHLLALFISAGLFSGLVSHIGHVRWQYPRLIARLQAASAARTASTAGVKAIATTVAETAPGATTKAAKAASEGHFSLGSSGAIYALFALTALGFPDAEITLVIPPWWPINIQTGFYTLVAIDLLGVLRGWRYLDHFAHLGGALFGVFWYKYGAEIWYTIRVWDLPAAFYLHGHGTRLLTPEEVQSRRRS